MPDNQAPATFYLGEQLNPETYEALGTPVFYRSSDLTTHGVILGVPSVGKTALGLVLMEETILDGIPVIIIDPRGDAANLMLTFPDSKPSNFKPWLPAGEARLAQMDENAYAKKVADSWREGLAASGIEPETVQHLRDSAQFSIYTPGSEAGIPVNILALERPPDGIGQEMYLERMRAVVTNLLTLSGITNKTPVDTEHIFLSTLLDYNWRKGIDIQLDQLIAQIPQPPITELGHLELDRAFPERERMKLANQLNILLASPESAIWRKGESIHIENFLYTPDNRPKVSIFYLAHLGEEMRTSIISVILEQLISWMHRQEGSQQLRAVVYVDEMYSYAPPHPYHPPTKDPFLYMMKEGRAFGVGMVMAASNPVDLDYRILSNAGTWFVGRLQMEQDRERLMESLGSIDDARNPFNIDAVEQTIKTMPEKAFLMHNIHQPDTTPLVMQVRFPMSYVRGSLNLDQIRQLKANTIPGKPIVPPAPPTLPEFSDYAPSAPSSESQGIPQPVQNMTLPTGISTSITQYFMPVMVPFSQAMYLWARQQGREILKVPPTQPIVYYPLLIAQARVRYYHPTWKKEFLKGFAFHVYEVPPTGLVQWGEWRARPINPALVQENPIASASYAPIQNLALDDRRLPVLEHNMMEFVHNQAQLTVPALPMLNMFAHPAEPFETFQARALEAARRQRDAELDALVDRYERKLAGLEGSQKYIQSQIANAYRQAQAEEGGGNIFSLAKTTYHLMHRHYFFSLLDMIENRSEARGERSQNSEFNQLMRVSQESEYKGQIDQLYQDYYAEVDALNEKWTAATSNYEYVPVAVSRDNISLELFGLGWIPYYSTTFDNQPLLLPAL